MAKFKAGDKVRINGIIQTLGSWPDDDAGPFLAFYDDNRGAKVQTTYWASQVDTEGEPVHTSADVEIVEAGSLPESTAGDIGDLAVDDEPEPSLSDEPDPVTQDAIDSVVEAVEKK